MSNNSSLPVEILEDIVEHVVSEYPKEADDHKFLPHWQWDLSPLLHVSKLWHDVTERHMYKLLSVGKSFLRATDSEAQETGPKREGFEVAKKLLETLTTSPRLAAFVEELQLAIKDVDDPEAIEWAQTNVAILRICSNVKHVEMRGFVSGEHDLGILTDVLKEKSLVSFHINRHGLVRRTPLFCALDLFDIMPKWPKLRSITIEGFALIRGCGEASGVGSSDVACWFPELRNVAISRLDKGALLDTELNTLRGMCSCVTNLSVSGWIDGESIRKALCECFRAWSLTLDRVSLQIVAARPMYRPLFETISTLTGLRELQIYAPRLNATSEDFGRIGDMPRLERFCFATQSGISSLEIQDLCNDLEDRGKFVALRRFVTTRIRGRKYINRLMNACLQRGVDWEVIPWNGADRESISEFVR